MMAPFVLAILLAAVQAILAYPIFHALRRRMPTVLAALLVTLGLVLGVLVPFGVILLSASHEIMALIGRLKLPTATSVGDILSDPRITGLLDRVSGIVPLEPAWFKAQMLDALKSVLETLSSIVGGFLASIPRLMLGLFVLVVSTFFFLIDGARFLRFLLDVSPMPKDRSRELFAAFERTCRGVVLGLLGSALAQGSIIMVFFWFTGLPNAVLMGMTGIVMGMIPIVGNAPITIGGTVYLLWNGQILMGCVLAVGVVLTGAIDNVVRPWVLKGQSEMHPLLALVSAFGATNLLGPTGIFLGPVIAAVFVSFLRILALEIRRENSPLPDKSP